LETLKSASTQTSDKSTFKRSAVKNTLAKRNERIRATPAARRAAREHGISLEKIAAAFPDKVLIEDDVNNFRKNG
jgi:pyruvate/2-oxoglutarate dehydrogenase complex dihydrolipoamide acyltransferase (E2) component